MQKISLCITNYNRNAYLFKSFEHVINDDRVGEVVISDDFSNEELFNAVKEKCKQFPKVKLFRNDTNLGCYANKHKSVSLAQYEYCIVFDSDNVISTDYLDAIYSQEWSSKVILAPDFASPVFDYRQFGGITFNKTNVSEYVFKKGFDCLINTMNYFVHRDSYLSVYQPKDGIKGADSIYMNYLWILCGNEIKVVKGMKYFHRIEHEKTEQKSNYISFAKDSAPMCDSLLQIIFSMR